MTTRLPGVPDDEVIGIIPAGQLLDLGIVEAVPILEVKWHDERTGCVRAHRYLAGELEGKPGDYIGCPFYCARRCSMNGKAANPCLFHEPEASTSWARVREWRLLEWPDGRRAVTLAHSAMEIAVDLGARVIGAAEVTKA